MFLEIILMHIVLLRLQKEPLRGKKIAEVLIISAAVFIIVLPFQFALPDFTRVAACTIFVLVATAFSFAKENRLAQSVFFACFANMIFLLFAQFSFFVMACGAFILAGEAGKIYENQTKNLDEITTNSVNLFLMIGTGITWLVFIALLVLQQIAPINSTAVIFLNAIIFAMLAILLLVFTNSVRGELNIRMKDESFANMLNYTNSIEKMATDARKFRHDHLNLLHGFDGYFAKNDINGLFGYYKKYANVFREETAKIETDALQKINPPEIRGVIAAKLLSADAAAETKIHIGVPYEFSITTAAFDLCRILGILLDNAVEACEKNSEAVLKFLAVKKDDGILFVIENTCRTTPNLSRIFKRGETTKKDGGGLGLYTASLLIEANPCFSLTTRVEQGFFIQELFVKEQSNNA
ncbi:MAG: GHKL domain-containing protein [Defluviitaleaceae bacterium]|nr:GHKL domain-containing protein [Defluviitaleaceae bacterium]MCL2263179.1 GHKL domain-containing protein [Defluviitaleaceae bacterium]